MEWPLAVSGAQDHVVIHLPTCSRTDVRAIDVHRGDSSELVWRVDTAAKKTTLQEFVVGETPPGFYNSQPLLAPLKPGEKYYARVLFDLDPASVLFEVGNLSTNRYWFDHHEGTPADYDHLASDTQLCGAQISLRTIFWTKFGLGCLITLIVATVLLLIQRRQRKKSSALAAVTDLAENPAPAGIAAASAPQARATAPSGSAAPSKGWRRAAVGCFAACALAGGLLLIGVTDYGDDRKPGAFPLHQRVIWSVGCLVLIVGFGLLGRAFDRRARAPVAKQASRLGP